MVVEQFGDTTVASLQGNHDLRTSPRLRDDLCALAAQNSRLVVDLSETGFIDSTVFGALLAASRKADEVERPLVMFVLPKSQTKVNRLFEIVRAQDLLVLCESRDEALRPDPGTDQPTIDTEDP